MKRVVIVGSRDIQGEERDLLILLAYHAVVMGYRVDSGLAPGSDDAAYLGSLAAVDAISKSMELKEKLGFVDMSICEIRDKTIRGYLPWSGFEGHQPTGEYIQCIGDKHESLRFKAYEMVRRRHSMFKDIEWGNITGEWATLFDSPEKREKWERFIKKARNINKLMTRNCFEVLGDELEDKPDLIISCAFGSKFDDEGKLMDCSGGTGMAVRLGHELGVPQLNIRVPSHVDEIIKIMDKWQRGEDVVL